MQELPEGPQSSESSSDKVSSFYIDLFELSGQIKTILGRDISRDEASVMAAEMDVGYS